MPEDGPGTIPEETTVVGIGMTSEPDELVDPDQHREPMPTATAQAAARAGRFDLARSRGSLRTHTARGVIINSAFQVGLTGLNLTQRVVVAAFLTVEEFGFWGLLVTTLMTIAFLKEVGISDKYIQQDEPDQVKAFQKAFTLEFAYSTIFFVLCGAVLPIYAAIYDRWDIVLPGAVLCLSLFGSALGAPLWIFYRRMDFAKQRTISAINPVCTTLTTIGLAIAGAGYWSLVIGSVFGTAVGGLVAIIASPYPMRFRYEPGTIREYFHFSWPLFVNQFTGLLVVQGSAITGNYTVGLAGLGAIGLATNFAQFTAKVDGIISSTLYPAVCAVTDRLELLKEAFVKSNRLAMMWGIPFGISLYVFGPDLVTYVLGEKWRIAENLIQFAGLMLGISQIAFNWTVFMRAMNNTRPLAIGGILGVGMFFAFTLPLMITDGLDGYLIGMGLNTLAQLLYRGYYMSRLFEGFSFWVHCARALMPSVPAVLLVYGMRALETGPRTFGVAVAELVLYWSATVVATWVFERHLVSEVIGYLRGRRGFLGGARPAAAG